VALSRCEYTDEQPHDEHDPDDKAHTHPSRFAEVVPAVVELEVAVPRSTPTLR